MKKKNVKILKLNKNSISNLEFVTGGRPPKSHRKRDCAEPEPVSASCFIESNCLGCTVSTVSG